MASRRPSESLGIDIQRFTEGCVAGAVYAQRCSGNHMLYTGGAEVTQRAFARCLCWLSCFARQQPWMLGYTEVKLVLSLHFTDLVCLVCKWVWM